LKIKGFFIKGQTYSWFRDDCQKCSQCSQCVSATGITANKLEYLLRIKGYRKVETEAMRKGKKLHEEMLKYYKTVDDYGIEDLRMDFLQGKLIRLSEVKVCSKLYGLRGIIDLLSMQFNPKSQSVVFDILDIKPALNSKYILQVATYGLILSDPDFEICYKKKGKRKTKTLGKKLLPDVPVKITINLHISTPKKDHRIEFMRENSLTKRGAGYKSAILRKAKEKRKLHKVGLWLIPELDSRVKERQRFFGKRKLLVKSKPVIKL